MIVSHNVYDCSGAIKAAFIRKVYGILRCASAPRPSTQAWPGTLCSVLASSGSARPTPPPFAHLLAPATFRADRLHLCASDAPAASSCC